MKTKISRLVATAILISFLTSCIKETGTTDSPLFEKQISDQTIQDIQTALVGSWQLIDKSTEIDDSHICSYNGIKWTNISSEEKQNFKQNGNYSRYLETTLMSKGSYKVVLNGTLELNTDVKNYSEKIVQLTTSFLTVKEGNIYFKYRKLN